MSKLEYVPAGLGVGTASYREAGDPFGVPHFFCVKMSEV